MSSNNPFEAVAAAAAGTNNTNSATLQTIGSEVSSLSSSNTDLPLTDTLAAVNGALSSSVDISRHPSGIVPVLQYNITHPSLLRKSC